MPVSSFLVESFLFNRNGVAYVHIYVTGFGKMDLIAQIMIFCIGVLVLPHLKTILGTKLLCLSQRYLPLFAYTHAKFERVEVFLKGQACCLKTAT